MEDERLINMENITTKTGNEGELDLAPSTPTPTPDHPPEPRCSGCLHHAPILDDNPQYKTSSYNHTQMTPESVGISWALVTNE